jgi:hypothetical protein
VPPCGVRVARTEPTDRRRSGLGVCRCRAKPRLPLASWVPWCLTSASTRVVQRVDLRPHGVKQPSSGRARRRRPVPCRGAPNRRVCGVHQEGERLAAGS